MKKVLFTATVDSHIIHFHIPFLKLFKENGYEVHVATNGDENIPYCDKKYVIPFQKNPFKLNNIKAIFQLRKIIEEEKYELIHTHTPIGSVVTRLASKKTRVKYGTRVMYTAHGFHFFKGAPKLNWMLFYPVEKYLSKYTDTLITINQEDYLLAKNKFKKCKDIQYVPGVGIDEEKFEFEMSESEKKNLKKSLGLKEEDFIIIYPARLDKNKNQGYLIEIMYDLKKYSNIHLLLPGEDSLNGYYKNLSIEKGLKNIHFLGYREDILKLLRISNVSVSSSLREGLPVNILEAIFSKVPVIALKTRGVDEIIENGINGYILEKNDKEKFINYILKFYYNEELIKVDNKDIRKKFNMDRIIGLMKKIYFS